MKIDCLRPAYAVTPLDMPDAGSLANNSNVFDQKRVLSTLNHTANTRPQLDAPATLDKKAYQNGSDALSEFVGDGFDLQAITQRILSELSDYCTKHLELQHGFFELERAWMQRKEDERGQVHLAHMKSAATAESYGKVSKALTSFGLLTAGVVGLATGGTTFAVASVVVGTCLVLDQLLEDKAKKQVALYLAKGTNETQEVWVNRIHLFFGIVSCALSINLQGPRAVEVAMNIATAASTSAKGFTAYKVSKNKAQLIELDAICKQSRASLESLLAEIQDTCTEIQRIHSINHDIDEKISDTMHIIHRSFD